MSEFQREVIDRLARIEEKVETNGGRLAEHTVQDEERFLRLETDLRLLLVAEGVRKETATRVAKSSGRSWGAAAGGAMVALAEAAKALLP